MKVLPNHNYGTNWRKSVISLLSLTLLLVFAIACNDDDAIPDQRDPTIHVIDLTGSVLVKQWTETGSPFEFEVADNVGLASYTVNINLDGANVFSVTSEDLPNLLQHETVNVTGLSPDIDYDAQIVATDVNGNDEELNFILRLTVEAPPLTPHIYATGVAFGWSSTALAQDPADPNVFTAEVDITYTAENKQFKFTLTEGNWDEIEYLVPEIIDANSVKVVTDGEYDMYLCSQPAGNLLDHFWGIPEGQDGTYKITVNVATMKLNVHKLPAEGTLTSTIFATGSAFNWTSTAFTQDPTDPNIYSYETPLAYNAENKLFKFTLTEGNWNEIQYLVPEVIDANSVKVAVPGEYDMYLCSEPAGNLLDHFWGIPEGADGNYKITVNTTTMKMTLELLP